MDVNWMYCGHHFATQTHIRSLHCMHETTITLGQLLFNKEINIILILFPSSILKGKKNVKNHIILMTKIRHNYVAIFKQNLAMIQQYNSSKDISKGKT